MLSRPPGERSARRAALSDRNKLRGNFFSPVSFETNFAFGPAALRHATCELNCLIKLRRCLKAREAMIVFQRSVTKKNDQENEKPAGHSGLSSNFAKFWKIWSGRRDSNPRPRPWQGRALPLSYTRIREAGGDRSPATGRAGPNAGAESNCSLIGR